VVTLLREVVVRQAFAEDAPGEEVSAWLNDGTSIGAPTAEH
jgi:hypothetical protein